MMPTLKVKKQRHRKGRYLPKVTQLVSSGVTVQIQAAWLRALCLNAIPSALNNVLQPRGCSVSICDTCGA